MGVHKYPHLFDSKQEIITIASDSFDTEEGPVPVVATAERERIVLYHWNEEERQPLAPIGPPHWKFSARTHVALDIPSDSFTDLPELNWSFNIGLATAPSQVFLVYKREFDSPAATTSSAGLFVERFFWDKATHNLVPVAPTPIPIPLQPGESCGFHLWAGVDTPNEHLLVLAQIVTANGNGTELRLLATDISTGANDLGELTSWKELVLDRGGFELDAVMVGDKLACVYRRSPAAIEATIGELGLTLDLSANIPDALHVPLHRTFVNTSQFAIGDGPTAIPGGAHPEIQALAPFILTCDRPSGGQILAIAPPLSLDTPMLAVIPLIVSDGKIVVVETEQGWSEALLKRRSSSLEPRNLAAFAGAQRAVSVKDLTLRFGFTLSNWPTTLVRMEGNAQEQLVLDFLLHDQFLGALVTERISLRPTEPVGQVVPQGQVVIDINHAQINNISLTTGARIQPNPTPDLQQFQPYQFDGTTTVGIENGVRVSIFSPQFAYDNTIGGALAARRPLQPLTLFAYTDLGDGGLRVLFDRDFSLPDPRPPSADAAFDPEAVSGTGDADAIWLELNESGWVPCALPYYNVLTPPPSSSERALSLITSIQLWLDFPFIAGANPVTWNQAMADGITAILGNGVDIWKTLWEIHRALANNGFANIGTLNLTLAAYTITYLVDGAGAPLSVTFTQNPTHVMDYRFDGTGAAQGTVSCRFPIRATTSAIAITNPTASGFLTINSLSVEFFYGQPFSPGILVSDQRGPAIETITDRNANRPQALSMKPIGDAWVEAGQIDIDLDVKFSNLLAAGFATFLVSMGLGAVAMAVTLLVSAIVAGSATPGIGWIVALIASAVLGVLVAIAIPAMLRAVIRGKIRQAIQSQASLNALNNSGILTNAGEGLAESIAVKLRALAAANGVYDSSQPTGVIDGRYRAIDQLWQTVVVGQGRLRMQIRRWF